MDYYIVEVFGDREPRGEGVLVVLHNKTIRRAKMLEVADKMKQRETIFLRKITEKRWQAKCFSNGQQIEWRNDALVAAGSVVHRNYFKHEEMLELIVEVGQKVSKLYSREFYPSYHIKGGFDTTGQINGKGVVFATGDMDILSKRHIIIEKRV